jgi:hypothetical protein
MSQPRSPGDEDDYYMCTCSNLAPKASALVADNKSPGYEVVPAANTVVKRQALHARVCRSRNGGGGNVCQNSRDLSSRISNAFSF